MIIIICIAKAKKNRKDNIMRNWFRYLSKEEIEANPDYREAGEFTQTYKPIKGRSYRWVYDDAIRAFDRATDTILILDQKAESMIKFVAPGTGLLGLAFVWLVLSLNACLWATVLIGIGIVLLCISMVSSLLSLSPHRSTFTPGVEGALECADTPEYDCEQALAKFATAVDWSTVGRIIVADFKGKYVRFAYKFFTFGLLPIFGGLLWAIVDSGL
jgi:hypothetical protein